MKFTKYLEWLRESIAFAVNSGHAQGLVVTLIGAGGGLWAWWVLSVAAIQPGFPGLADAGDLRAAAAVSATLFAVAADYCFLWIESLIVRIWPTMPHDAQKVSYQLPPWPLPDGSFRLVLGERHGLKKGYVRRPAWFILPELGLYVGTIVFGAPGTAKTAGMIRPALIQLLSIAADNPDRKACGLVMDSKASLVEPVENAMREAGREADLIVIGPEQHYRWNPVHAPHADPRLLAKWIMDAMHNLAADSGKGDTAWINDSATRLAECAIGLIRLAAGYVTLEDLHSLVTELEATIGAAPEGVSPGNAASAFLAAYDRLFEACAPLPGERNQYDSYRRYLAVEFPSQDGRYRAIYVSEITRLTHFFVNPRFREKFCPAESEINFPGFVAAMNRGLVVVVDANADVHGDVALALGTFLKLQFQSAIRARVALPGVNQDRPALFVIDEYQKFISLDDSDFFDVCRQSKVVSLLATQSRAGLLVKVGKDRVDAILGSIGTKLFLRLAEPQDQKWASEVCGAEWGEVGNTNISESVSGAKLAAGGGFVGDSTTVAESHSVSTQKINRVEPVAFRDLPTFAAIVSGFDGRRALYPELIYLKPYFRPADETYRDFIGREHK